eukprot:5962747-Prymnesium_polylepis.1
MDGKAPDAAEMGLTKAFREIVSTSSEADRALSQLVGCCESLCSESAERGAVDTYIQLIDWMERNTTETGTHRRAGGGMDSALLRACRADPAQQQWPAVVFDLLSHADCMPRDLQRMMTSFYGREAPQSSNATDIWSAYLTLGNATLNSSSSTDAATQSLKTVMECFQETYSERNIFYLGARALGLDSAGEAIYHATNAAGFPADAFKVVLRMFLKAVDLETASTPALHQVVDDVFRPRSHQKETQYLIRSLGDAPPQNLPTETPSEENDAPVLQDQVHRQLAGLRQKLKDTLHKQRRFGLIIESAEKVGLMIASEHVTTAEGREEALEKSTQVLSRMSIALNELFKHYDKLGGGSTSSGKWSRSVLGAMSQLVFLNQMIDREQYAFSRNLVDYRVQRELICSWSADDALTL